MKKMLVLALMLSAGIALSGCGGGDNSSQVRSQQAQIVTLQTQLSAVQTQLSSAKADGSVYGTGINTAIASLKQTESALATLAGQPANANATPLTTAANQILVLQSLAASLSSDTSALSTAYATAQASITSLTAQLSAANAQVTSLTAQLAASQSSNSTLTSQLAAANGQVTTLTGQIATLNSAKATLQSQLDTANGTIATQASTITSLNSTISTLQAQISAMVATPVVMGVSSLTSAVSTTITVTATFPGSQNGKTATFTATGGNLLATPVTSTIAGTTASATFSSASAGTFNIYVTEGLYAGGAIVAITAAPAPTYSISGTISLNGTGLQNVIVALTGTATSAVLTDASGNYTFAGLQNGGYTVTPSLSGYSFQPSSRTVTVNDADATGRDFTDIITATYSCSGTLSPLGRWCDNNDGTVRDMTTGLLWLKDANCAATLNGVTSGAGNTWQDAVTWSSQLGNGSCGLSDGSPAHDWRLPTIGELDTLECGTEPVLFGTPRLFTNIQSNFYWSSYSFGDGTIWEVTMSNGYGGRYPATNSYYIWPVRAGQL